MGFDLILSIFSEGKWLNYIVIIAVTMIVLIFINFFFPNNSVKKILLFLTVLVTAGIALVFTAKRRNWTAEANKNRKEIDSLLNKVNKNNKIIEENNRVILEKEREKSKILINEKKDFDKIDKINTDLDALRQKSVLLNKKAAEQDKEIAESLADVKKDTSFTSDDELLASLGLVGKRATVQHIVPDPQPVAQVDVKNVIEVNGFVLKGDV